ncbi:MAG: alpha/beta hydrolase [Rhodobacteraceae bacterium]|nr:alpha/beta hydrolase [Paracoccaceae bacterium]
MISDLLTQSAPFLDTIVKSPGNVKAYWLTTSDNIRIRVAIWSGGTKGTILILNGRNEFVEKYAHLALTMQNRGYTVITHDWRGQGLSDRIHSNPKMCHVNRFEDFQIDLASVLRCFNHQFPPAPHYILAHSMGCCIGLRALMNGISIPVSACAFSAPMWKIAKATFLARRFVSLINLLGQGHKFIQGAGPESLLNTTEPHNNPLTSCPETFLFLRNQVNTQPEVSLGGPSWNWAYQAFLETEKLMNLSPPKHNSLVLVAGNDEIVDNRAAYQFCAQWPQSHLVEMKNAKHELLKERQPLRDEALDHIFRFFDQFKKPI